MQKKAAGKVTRAKKPKEQGKGLVVIPVIKGSEMKSMMKALGARRAGVGKCGKCNEDIGIAWCNADLPSNKWRLTLTRYL